jgi:hypothetical protein
MTKPSRSSATLALAALASFGALTSPVVADTAITANPTAGPKITLTTGDGQQAQATLLDNATARAFAHQLPLTIRMGDHFQRELYGSMPPIVVSDPLQKTYKTGDIAYWPPAPGFAIYYTVAGPVIPGDGLALLGSIDTNLDIFRNGGTEVTIELVE